MLPVKHRFLGSMHRSEMWLHLQRLMVILLMVSSSIAQTFQYSRGWTNGKRSFPISQVTCQLQRLKAMLQGKSLPPIWPGAFLKCYLQSPKEGALVVIEMWGTIHIPLFSYLLCGLYRTSEDLNLEHLDKTQPMVSLSDKGEN